VLTVRALVGLIQLDHIAGRIDNRRLVAEPLAVLLLVHGVTVFANGRDGSGQVVDLDRSRLRASR
jgi:hypothetical protein